METPAPSPLDIAAQVYEVIRDHTESFALEQIGEDLAYLLGAIVTTGYCEWKHDRPILKILRREMEGHPIWRFIRTY